ncbi:hypothetical protein IWQ60_010630 [Tieghemiomyces parasiticus]|uniref:Uncharacterized protein n=1 Tax=Tieghemiomyces parasiticus TaxID=78921 RepID=A0A9W8DNA8_9FUNG|nr:hypothetical protein IWQ60_010630 [Tieghemiomyces parasiticus]
MASLQDNATILREFKTSSDRISELTNQVTRKLTHASTKEAGFEAIRPEADEINLHFARIREYQRLLNAHAAAYKQTVNAAMAEADRLSSTMQALTYEKSRVVQEIHELQSAPSVHAGIDLEPMEDFQAQAAEAGQDLSELDHCDILVKRLENERLQRQRLEAKKTTIMVHMRKVTVDVNVQKGLISGLVKQIENADKVLTQIQTNIQSTEARLRLPVEADKPRHG